MGEPAPRPTTAGWEDPGQIEWYLDRIGRLEPRLAGEQLLAQVLPREPRRVLDLGCGDGRLSALVVAHRPSVESVVTVDRSEPMLERARDRFADHRRVVVCRWYLRDPIGPLGAPGSFDLVVPGFATHHLEDVRKRAVRRDRRPALAGRAVRQLGGGGFDHAAPPRRVPRRHRPHGRRSGGPAGRRGRPDGVDGRHRAHRVECLWRWCGFALLVGEAPGAAR